MYTKNNTQTFHSVKYHYKYNIIWIFKLFHPHSITSSKYIFTLFTLYVYSLNCHHAHIYILTEYFRRIRKRTCNQKADRTNHPIHRTLFAINALYERPLSPHKLDEAHTYRQLQVLHQSVIYSHLETPQQQYAKINLSTTAKRRMYQIVSSTIVM